MEIFQARCPDCVRDFDCDIGLLGPLGARLRCPWCGRYFDRDRSPRLFVNPNHRPRGAGASGGKDGADLILREFDPDVRGR